MPFKIYSILLLTLFAFSSCTIIESEETAVGSIFVSSFDTTGAEITGAKIYLNGIERSESTPATLENIPVGSQSIKVKKPGFTEEIQSVNVILDQIESVSFTLFPAAPGFLEVISDPPAALILIDGQSTGQYTPFLFDAVESGSRNISVFLDGYTTLSPSLQTFVVDPSDTASASFNLQSGTPGFDEGKIAYDFTLIDDYGNETSLHQYRGQIVMLSFFFSTCQPCLEEFPEIEEAFQHYAEMGVVVLGIDPMFSDELSDVQNVRSGLDLSFKLLLDFNAVVNQQYQLQVFPTNIIIEPSGVIHTRFENQLLTFDILSEVFDEILNQ